MRIKQNPLIKALTFVVIFVPIYYVATNNTDEESANGQPSGGSGNQQQVVTQNEEIAALSGYVTSVEEELKNTKNQLNEMVTEDDIKSLIAEVKGKGETVDQDKLMKEVNTLLDQKLGNFKKGLVDSGSVKSNEVGNVDDEIPFNEEFEIDGIEDAQVSASADDEIQWIYPVGVELEEGNVVENLLGGNAFGDTLASAGDTLKNGATATKDALEEELKPIPYLTLPPDSSIHGAKSLNALVGRIERSGKTHDPFKFQIMLSGETLIANGHKASRISNAMVSGSATGDWANSCVRGRITSLTFVFDDGRIFNQKGTYEAPLAFLGDKWGNPCVRGVLVDDLEKFVAVQGGISGLATIADQVAKQQTSITGNDNSQSVELTGSAGKLAAGSFANGALNTTQEILAERYESYYEAVYVAPGEVVSLLVEQMIAIDYIPTNRKVNYDESSTGFASLD